MFKKVTCESCGFLAIRHKQTRELREVEAEMRERWSAPGFEHYNKYPVCFRRAAKLKDEAYKHKVPWQEQIKLVITGKRPCAHQTDWEQGFTPKEHQEVINRKQLRLMEWGWTLLVLAIGLVLGKMMP